MDADIHNKVSRIIIIVLLLLLLLLFILLWLFRLWSFLFMCCNWYCLVLHVLSTCPCCNHLIIVAAVVHVIVSVGHMSSPWFLFMFCYFFVIGLYVVHQELIRVYLFVLWLLILDIIMYIFVVVNFVNVTWTHPWRASVFLLRNF